MAKQEFPKWAYGPKGEARIFQEGEKIPKGWADSPNAFAQDEPELPTGALSSKRSEAKESKAADAEEQRYRSEVMSFLREAGIPFDENASTDDLEALMPEE